MRLVLKGKTFGTLKLAGDDLFSAKKRPRWEIACAPHVMLRLKRVFERIPKASRETAALDATPENARELLWFMERYPLEADRATLAALDRLAAVDLERERLVTDVLSGAAHPRLFSLALPPRDYQALAAELCVRSGGLLVADELGLGKTVTAICMLAAEGSLPALVVTQAHLQTQWRDQITKFAPSMRTHILKKGTPYDLRAVKGGEPDVIISSYSKLHGWSEALAGKVNAFVADEAQEFRHAEDGRGQTTNKYSAGKHIADHARRRMGLTATPIYNYGGEMFNVLSVIAPGVLGSQQEFGREWCQGGWSDKAIIADPGAFGAYLRSAGLMLARTRKEVGRELPPMQRIPHEVDADEKALDAVERDVAELAKIILSKGSSFDKMRAGGELDWRMRQATGIAKAPFVSTFVKLLLESERKVVLWGWHHEVYRIWEAELRAFAPAIYTGQESPAAKDRARDRFIKDPLCRVLIMSVRSGAGLDGIQAVCRTGVAGELDWSPAVHRQCEGRLDRDGQPEPVVVYYPIANSGSDPIIADTLGLKTEQLEGIIGDADATNPVASQVDPHHIAKLARAVLERRGLPAQEVA